jgi:hypothetical protein
MLDGMTTTDAIKGELHRKLGEARSSILAKVAGLDEYDRRRPLTASGTNLLGLVKHLSGLEYVYLGTSFGRPPAETLAWEADGSVWENGDMWARSDESSDYLIDLYLRAGAHGDETIAALDLDAVGSVPHWPADRSRTTLGVLLIRMVAETAQHAGHADILRELVDGRVGAGAEVMGDQAWWDAYHARISAAAEAFRGA